MLMKTIFLLSCGVFIAAESRHPIEYDPGNLPDERTCPISSFGCIFDDIAHTGHTDCTSGGNSLCQAAGADYCGGFVGFPPKRTCCDVTEVTVKMPKADTRGCPASNRGCIINDYASNTPCTKGGNDLCKEAGLHYCGAVFNNPGRRVCCKVALEPAHLPSQSTEEVQCPPRNAGCIFDHRIGSTDCTAKGNRECAKAGEDYCSALIEGRRVCCNIPGKKSRGEPTRGAGGAYACPAVNKGCIYTDEHTDVDCTKKGSYGCKAADTDYCGAFYGFPPRRSCCNIARSPKVVTPVTGIANVPVPVVAPAPVAVAGAYPQMYPSVYPQFRSPFPGWFHRKQ